VCPSLRRLGSRGAAGEIWARLSGAAAASERNGRMQEWEFGSQKPYSAPDWV